MYICVKRHNPTELWRRNFKNNNMENIKIDKELISQNIREIESEILQRFLTTPELKNEAKNNYVTSNHLDFEYNTDYWTEEEKLIVLFNVLQGMKYFHKDYSEGKSFPIGNFNNVKKVLLRQDNMLFVNKKSIYKFSPEALMILKK